MTPAEARASVLYADDDADDRELMALVGERAGVGYTLLTAGTGAETLDLLASRAAEGALPCLVLLDVKMPDLDGFEVLSRIRAEPATRGLFVVLYSSSVLASDVARARAEGASLFVPKPSGIAALTRFAQAVDRFVRSDATDPSALAALAPAP